LMCPTTLPVSQTATSCDYDYGIRLIWI